jgi:cytoskeleton protein RodZ
MSPDWNVETVADSKPEAPLEKPSQVADAAIGSTASSDQSLGKLMAKAREARGFSREQAASASSIPGYYLTMIETDDYSSIADQLYLLPFLRRYATFVGLDAEEVASRFIRDVQRSDMNPVRVSEPITIISPRKAHPWGMMMRAGAFIVILAIAWFGYHHFIRKPKAPAATQQAVSETGVTTPEKDEPAPVPAPAAAVPARAAPAPVTVSAPKPVAHPVAPASSSAPAGGSAARPRVPIKAH